MKKDLRVLKDFSLPELVGELLSSVESKEVYLIDGFDCCIVDIKTDSKSDSVHLVYSKSSILEKIRESNNFNLSEAKEWFYHSISPISGLSNGPVFLEDLGEL